MVFLDKYLLKALSYQPQWQQEKMWRDLIVLVMVSLDAYESNMIDDNEKKVYLEFSDYSPTYIFFDDSKKLKGLQN